MAQTPPPTIDPAPTSPQRGDRANFSNDVDAFVTWLVSAVLQFLALAQNVYANAVDAYNNATAAASSATSASASAAAANASALTAVNAPGTTGISWTSLAIPTSLPTAISFATHPGKALVPGMMLRVAYVASPSNWMQGTVIAYDSVTGGVSMTVTHAQGAGTYSDWSISLAPPILTQASNAVVSKAAGFTANKFDKGRLFETSGTWTLALDAVASLEDGWYIYVMNAAGAGVITVDPNGSELIQDYSSIEIQPGDNFIITCNGAALKAVRISGRQYRVLTSGTSFRPPYDCTAVVTVIGGGQASRYDSSVAASNYGGNGGGGSRKALLLKRAVSYTTAIGAGGAATNTANSGGTTSFSGAGITTMQATGGGNGGVGSGGDLNLNGGQVNIGMQAGGKAPFLSGANNYGDGGDGTLAAGASNIPGKSGVILVEF